MENIIVANNLTKKYSNNYALRNINTCIKKGEIYGLIGKNGAGKTTFLKILCGIIDQTDGEISLFNGETQSDLYKARKRIGAVIETPGFYSYLSAKENLEYYRIQRGIPEKNINELIDIVGLQNAGNKKFKQFSLGMKQRLGLALSIMGNPDLLVLDEPINGLDPTGIVQFREILLRLNKEKNVTIIISSHILGELSQMATMYGFIDKGELIQEISSKDLHEKCKECLSLKIKDNVEKTVNIIEKELKLNKFTVISENEIKLYEYVDKPEIITECLVKNGIRLCEIYAQGQNLEDYFVNLVGGKSND